ncbi:MAG: XdhC family protein [Myxococcota bacterium]
MKDTTLDALRAARAAKNLTAVVTDLESGAEALWIDGKGIDGKEVDGNDPADLGLAISDSVEAAVAEAARKDASQVVEDDSRRLFIRVFSPPQRLLIIGAVHVAQSLSAMAREAGYAVALIDPRDTWATPERFPDIEIDRRWPDEALADLAIDRRTALVALSHDPKLDEPALSAALSSDAFYIGALGSRRTHARRLDRLRVSGFDDEQLSRIRGPVGLDIGAVSPAEIAVSILAEITQQLRVPAPR